MSNNVNLSAHKQWAYQCSCGGTTFYLCAHKPGDLFEFFICSECEKEHQFGDSIPFTERQILTWFTSLALSGGPSLLARLKTALKAEKPNRARKDRAYIRLIKAVSGEDTVTEREEPLR